MASSAILSQVKDALHLERSRQSWEGCDMRFLTPIVYSRLYLLTENHRRRKEWSGVRAYIVKTAGSDTRQWELVWTWQYMQSSGTGTSNLLCICNTRRWWKPTCMSITHVRHTAQHRHSDNGLILFLPVNVACAFFPLALIIQYSCYSLSVVICGS